MVTAENLTREQLLRLRDQAIAYGATYLTDCNAALAEHSVHCGAVLCSTLCETTFTAEETWAARARCAEILNQRAKESK